MKDQVISAVKEMIRRAKYKSEADILRKVIDRIQQIEEVTCRSCRFNQTFRDYKGSEWGQCSLTDLTTSPGGYCHLAEKMADNDS